MATATSNYLPMITSLSAELASATSVIATMTERQPFIEESRSIQYISASLTYLAEEQLLATATNSAVIQSASAGAANASAILSSLYSADNIYGMNPSKGGNMAMAIVMGIFFACHTIIGLIFHTWWFGISYFCGVGLEMAGYIGRALSADDPQEINYFLLQIICLTIAPCFIMAGIYYLLAQFIMVYGTKFSYLKPLWYSYVFVTFDVISLVIQAAGGGIAAMALQRYESSTGGTHVMVAGLAFQVFSMSVFLFLYISFFWKIKYMRKGHQDLEPEFNQDYKHLRSRKWFQWFPVVVFIAVLFVYTRSIYRVVELSEGWSGFLIVHEVYFMILDALMMALAIVVLIPFHPGFIFGRHAVPILGTKKHKKHMERKEQEMGQTEKSNIDYENQESRFSDQSQDQSQDHYDRQYSR